jgi:hypothetical protein
LCIPKGNHNKDILFGDPMPGIVKTIFINNVEYDNNLDIIYNLNLNLLSDDTMNSGSNAETNVETNTKQKYNFAIMAIFKNETMNLKVWLDHYLWQGVEHFYLIDNGSTDNPMNILQEYIDKGIVTYYYRPDKHQQAELYRYMFDNENLKTVTKWLCICDLDEFFFGTNTKLNIVLNEEFNNYDVIYTHSFFYGSDNLTKHPKDIRTDIIHRTNDTVNGIKYIFKPAIINNSSEVWTHWLVEPGTLYKKSGQNETFTDTKFRLNHYIVQSLEYFQNVKMTRGAADVITNENIRTMDVFNEYTKTAIIKDDILKQIIENGYDKK